MMTAATCPHCHFIKETGLLDLAKQLLASQDRVKQLEADVERLLNSLQSIAVEPMGDAKPNLHRCVLTARAAIAEAECGRPK